ncbi:hypothetical protein ACH5RR_017698 [Cinchona calisaya]|uniref:Uncharacterized protein n=1 Tax=Cinchona calisaya TaxID=153742 RepID=A0ABD2ZK36_9GENT
MQGKLKWIFFLQILLITINFTHAQEAECIVEKLERKIQQQAQSGQDSELKVKRRILGEGEQHQYQVLVELEGVGCSYQFSLLLLKTASSFTASMVTGLTIANIAFNVIKESNRNGGKTIIDYDIALLSEPCFLLGVSIGVICNIMLPH